MNKQAGEREGEGTWGLLWWWRAGWTAVTLGYLRVEEATRPYHSALPHHWTWVSRAKVCELKSPRSAIIPRVFLLGT